MKAIIILLALTILVSNGPANFICGAIWGMTASDAGYKAGIWCRAKLSGKG